jgi:hypothetical protein
MPKKAHLHFHDKETVWHTDSSARAFSMLARLRMRPHTDDLDNFFLESFKRHICWKLILLDQSPEER